MGKAEKIFALLSENTSSAELWRALALAIHHSREAKKTEIVQRIRSMPLDSPFEHFLKNTCLHFIDNTAISPTDIAKALSLELPAELLMTWVNLTWVTAISQSKSHQEFHRIFTEHDVFRIQSYLASKLSLSRSAGRSTSNRIAIITPQLANKRHGPTVFALGLASLLNKNGMNTAIYASQDTEIPFNNLYSGSPRFLKAEKVTRPDILVRHGRTRVVVSDGTVPLRERYNDLLEKIADFDPRICFFAGFASPLAHKVYEQYPLVGLSTHSMNPPVPVDTLLTPKDSDSESEPSDSQSPSYSAIHFPYRFWPKDDAPRFSRSKLGIPESAVVVTTASFRCNIDLPPGFTKEFLRSIQSKADIYWLVIGVGEKDTINDHCNLQNVVLHPPVEQLTSMLKMSDIYMAAPSVGGGNAVVDAMQFGLPVVAFAGTDGGDKIGASAVRTPAEGIERVEELSRDAKLRVEEGNKMREYFRHNLDMTNPAAIEVIERAIKEAELAFTKRVNK